MQVVPDAQLALQGLGAQLGERALYLGLDIECLEPLALTPFVAGAHKLAHLLGERGVPGALAGPARPGVHPVQPGELGVDVERRVALANEAVAAGREHLADFELALGLGVEPGSPRRACLWLLPHPSAPAMASYPPAPE